MIAKRLLVFLFLLSSIISFSQNEFITTWETTTTNETITIPTTGAGYNYTVDWGDSTTDSNVTGDAMHTYATTGTQTIKIIGIFPRIYFNNTGDKDKIQAVTQWGNIEWTSMNSAFKGCTDIAITAIDAPNLTNVTEMQQMFALSSMNQNINHWNVATITNMYRLFYLTPFNQPLNSWQVGSVTNMINMFHTATAFNQDLSSWDVNEVESMQGMFNGTALNQDLGTWDISSVTNMNNILLNASLSTTNYDATLIGWATLDTNEAQIPTSIDFNGGNSQYCFSTTLRQELITTHGWDITDAGQDCDFDTWFITEWLTTTTNESITIPTNGTGYNYAVDWGDGILETGFTGDATHTYATAGTHEVKITGDFPRIYFNDTGDKEKIQAVTQWGTIEWSSMNSAFKGCTNIAITAIDAPDLTNVTNLQQLFALSGMNQNINHWNVTTITNMYRLFYLTSFNQPLNSWQVDNVDNMINMFHTATAFNQDLSSWNVSKVESMQGMFNGTALDQDLGAWDISSITDMSNMLSNTSLSTTNYDATLIGWATLDTGEAQIPTGITFNANNSQYCESITKRQELIDTYNWTIDDAGTSCDFTNAFITTWLTTANNESITIPTTGVGYDYAIDWGDGSIEYNITGNTTHTYTTAGTQTIKIIGAFPRIHFDGDYSSGLKIQTVAQWGTIQWTSMEGAFSSCYNLQIPATDAPDLSNVTSLSEMFTLCGNFNNAINHWDVSTITNMSDMFYNTPAFNQPLNNWNVSKVTTMAYMFNGATNFNQPLDNWNVSKVTTMDGIFGATNFNQDLSTWDISSVTNMEDMLEDTALSTTNYDATLIGWATLDTTNGETQIPTGITFDGGNSQYCESETQRQELITTYGWSIDDAGTSCDFTNAFITSWETTTDNESITIPTTGGGYDYVVDWGDGTVEIGLTGNAIHTYATAETQTIKIIGDFPRIYFNDTAADKDKIKTVEQWGTIEWASMESAFYGCSNLQVPAIDAPDLSNVTSLFEMFYECTVFNSSINHWNVSTITNMSTMFTAATAFNQLLNNWDVSKVTNMYVMFSRASAFNQSLNDWDVSKVTNMTAMFYSNTVFNQPLNNWDVSNVTHAESMFGDAPAFNQPLNNWNVSSIIELSAMFWNTSAFNQDLSTWDISNLNSLNSMFRGATAFDQDLSTWDISSVTSMKRMFDNAGLSIINYDTTLIGWATLDAGEAQTPTNITFDGGSSQYCFSETKRQELIDTYNWTITDGGQDCTNAFITTWKTTTDNESITVPTTSGGYDYVVNWGDGSTDSNITGDATHTYATAGTYEVKITGDFPRIYFSNSGDKDKIQTVEQWGIIEWISMENAFYGCSNLQIAATDTPDLSIVTRMSNMFRNATSFNQSLNNWVVSNVESMVRMFQDATSFNQPVDNWDVSHVIYMDSMFEGAVSFNQPLNNWTVNSVDDMSNMFRDATSFNQPLNNWVVSDVTNMSGMFVKATSFNQSLNTWDVSSVTNMSYMFEGAVSFNQPLNNWNVSNITNMTSMFENVVSFDLDLSVWDISSVTSMSNMFRYASLYFSNYDNTLIGWATDSSGVLNDGIDDVPSNINFHGGSSQYCLSEAKRQELIDTYGWTINDDGLNCITDIIVSPKVFLQGAYLNPNTGEETLMRDDLRIGNYIPTTSPYTDAITCDASVFTVTGNNAIVDWVWVELRYALDNTVIIDEQSALLQRDGDVVGVDGISPLVFIQYLADYYVAIAHRNHLGIITENPITLSSTTTVLDFSTILSLINGGANAVTDLGNGLYGLSTGDFDGNGQIQNTDLTSVLQLLGTSGYSFADLDNNGQVQNSEVNNILLPNIGLGEQTARAIQLPIIIAPRK